MLKIHSKVNTPWGEGIIVSMRTAYNCSYIVYEQTQCSIWFGEENPGIMEGDNGSWITKEMSLKELIEMNHDTIRNEKINDILDA